MNNVRLNVDEIPIAISGLFPDILHVHNPFIAEFSVLGWRKNQMEIVGVFVNVEEHGTSIATTSSQSLHGCYWKLPLMNCVSCSGHRMPQTHRLYQTTSTSITWQKCISLIQVTHTQETCLYKKVVPETCTDNRMQLYLAQVSSNRNCVPETVKPASNLHHLLPPPRNTSVISRLRSSTPLPHPTSLTKNLTHL